MHHTILQNMHKQMPHLLLNAKRSSLKHWVVISQFILYSHAGSVTPASYATQVCPSLIFNLCPISKAHQVHCSVCSWPLHTMYQAHSQVCSWPGHTTCQAQSQVTLVKCSCSVHTMVIFGFVHCIVNCVCFFHQ